jgi:hypothetical protein
MRRAGFDGDWVSRFLSPCSWLVCRTRTAEQRRARRARRQLGVVGVFDLDGWDVAEAFVQAVVVEPVHPLEHRELHLAAGSPDAIADQLGLERVDERLGEGVDA